MEIKYSREDLIEICKEAVVPFREWGDRDSYSAQRSVESIYQGLMANIPYTYKIEGNTIWMTFEGVTDDHITELNKYSLDIDSLEDYREVYGYEDEMFDGEGIDWHSSYLGTYMPTRERLNEGGDWY